MGFKFREKKDNLTGRLTKEERKKIKQMGVEEYVRHLRCDNATYGIIPEAEIVKAIATYVENKTQGQPKGFKETVAAGVKEAIGENALYTLGATSRLLVERSRL